MSRNLRVRFVLMRDKGWFVWRCRWRCKVGKRSETYSKALTRWERTSLCFLPSALCYLNNIMVVFDYHIIVISFTPIDRFYAVIFISLASKMGIIWILLVWFLTHWSLGK
jgi:hypothetical protein